MSIPATTYTPFGCFLEKQVAEALTEAGMVYQLPERLDFYLSEKNLYIEIKQYHSERSAAQLATQENVILLQGKEAVDFFCQLLKRGG